MSQQQPRARRGPNWTVVYVFLGLALIAFLVSALLIFAPPVLRDWTARTGLTAAREWRPMTNTYAITEPEYRVVPETGELQVTVLYATNDGKRVDAQDLNVFCGQIGVPSGWRLYECQSVEGRPNQYVVSIRR